eukprot:762973-Rhodomonas_salina.2
MSCMQTVAGLADNARRAGVRVFSFFPAYIASRGYYNRRRAEKHALSEGELLCFPSACAHAGTEIPGRHSAEGVELTSQVNQRKFFVGEFEAPTLSQLRSRLQQFGPVPAAQENNAKRTDDSDLQHAGSDASSCVGPGREAGWDAEKPQASESDAALQEAVGAAHVSESTKAGDDAAFDELGAASMPSDASTPQLGGLTFSNIADNARSVHMDPANAGSVFQVASQFNCLEMVGPGERPEDGITQYFLDKTQGPGSSASCIHAFYAASIADFAHRKTACAMACPAATLFRNYFCPVKRCAQLSASACAVRLPALEWSGQLGGSPKQLDTTASVAKLVDNEKHKYWKMSNGYLLPQTTTAMRALGERLKTETVASGSGERVLLAEAGKLCPSRCADVEHAGRRALEHPDSYTFQRQGPETSRIKQRGPGPAFSTAS